MISLEVVNPSRICLPSTNPIFSEEIRLGNRGFSHFTIRVAIIL